MFTEFIGFVKALFIPFLNFFEFLPGGFKHLFLGAIALLVAVACKRTVTQ